LEPQGCIGLNHCLAVNGLFNSAEQSNKPLTIVCRLWNSGTGSSTTIGEKVMNIRSSAKVQKKIGVFKCGYTLLIAISLL
jgi:hypothetical protein